MANTFKLKRSAVAAKVPSTGDLQLGELALNTYDGKLYTKKDNGTASVVEIGAAGAGATGPQGPTGVAGTAGATGSTGPQGATGISSTSFTYSSSAPVSPSAGDEWLDSTSGILYTYVNDGNSSAWVELGPFGTTGTAGATGVTGATGVAGPVGVSGVSGATGAIGVSGATGVTGSTGPQGATGISSTSFTYSSSAPVSPSAGDEWLDSTSGILYTYVNDGNSSAWVELGPFGAQSISPTIAGMIF